MDIKVLKTIDGGVQVGSESCACGSCHPTATVYLGDPLYERHDPHLAEGPCCCGRFFAIGNTVHGAREMAEGMALERRRAVLAHPEDQRIIDGTLARYSAEGVHSIRLEG